jgi:hypothetical protein
MSTVALRRKFIVIARQHVGKKEVTRNQAPWIKTLWPATSYPSGHDERQPYCAAGVAWAVREWLKDPEVLKAFEMTPEQAEFWRCKSASCYKAKGSWLDWAKLNKMTILGKDDNFHTGDLIIYDYSHIEIYVDDLPENRFMAIGFNTNDAAGRDGDGCWEKPRSRAKIKAVIRLLP